MSEIVSIQVGQCGNQLGTKFWQLIAEEHNVDLNTGKRGVGDAGRSSVYFENVRDRLIPRAIAIDLEPGPIDALRASSIGRIFNPAHMIHGKNGAGNNWATGYYGEGRDLVDETMDTIRREIERCDAPQGFQLIHSTGGGTGSGLGTLLLSKIADDYPDRMLATFSVAPSKVVTEPYNSMLALAELREHADLCFLFDNQAVDSILTHHLRVKHQELHFRDVNRVIALTMSGITTSLRFPGELNAGLRKLAVNMVPFPRVHFLACSFAPLVPARSRGYAPTSHVAADLVNEMFEGRTVMSDCDLKAGHHLAASVLFRGESVSSAEVENALADVQRRRRCEFVPWIPNNVKSAICSTPPPAPFSAERRLIGETGLSATFISNNTAIRTIFERLAEQFHAMLNRKAYLHTYENEGMSIDDFRQAGINVAELVSSYQVIEEADDEGEFDEGQLLHLRQIGDLQLQGSKETSSLPATSGGSGDAAFASRRSG